MSGVVLKTFHNELSFNNHNNVMGWIVHLIDEETEDAQNLANCPRPHYGKYNNWD